MNKEKIVVIFLIFSAVLASCMVYYIHNEAKKPSISLLSEEIEETSYSSFLE